MSNRNRDPRLSVPQILLWTLVLTVSPSPLRAQDGIEVPKTTHDPGLYLFVDDHWSADQQGLTRINNREFAGH